MNVTVENELEKTPVIWCFTFISALNLMVAFCVSEYFNRQTLASILSFNASDEPGPLAPYLYPAHAPFGKHYFGDFFQILQMSRLHSPYITVDNKLISQYPPIAHWFLYPFKIFDTRIAVILYVLISIVFLSWAIHKLTLTLDLRTRPIVFLLFLLSGPAISLIDRGNITLIIFTLTVLSLTVTMSEFNKVIVQVLSIGMKFFPMVFFLEVERAQRSKNACRSFFIEVSAVILLSFLGFSLLGWGFGQNLKGFFSAFISQGNFLENSGISGVSLSAFIGAIQSLFDLEFGKATIFMVLLVTIFSFITLLVQYFGPISRKTLVEERLLVICSLICLVPTIVGTYQLVFYLIPLVMYLKHDLNKKVTSLNTFLLIVLTLPNRYEISGGVFLSNLVAAPCMLILLINTLRIQVRRAG